MGVDEASVGDGDQQVVLRRAGADENDVAGFDLPLRLDQSSPFSESQLANDRSVTQAVASWGRHWSVTSRQRGRDYSDAVEPGCRVASMQPERGAHQRFGAGGDLGCTHRPTG